MEDQNVAFRLKGFIDSQGLSSSQFADLCGIPRPSLSQLLTGRNKKISDILVGQIHKAFPQLSVLWLLFGEGDMLESPRRKELDVETKSQETDSMAFRRRDLPKYPSNFSLLPDDGSDEPENSNLRALELEENYKKRIDNLRIEADKKISELQAQIRQLKTAPRKVAQITVYYDDSTFETFYSKG